MSLTIFSLEENLYAGGYCAETYPHLVCYNWLIEQENWFVDVTHRLNVLELTCNKTNTYFEYID